MAGFWSRGGRKFSALEAELGAQRPQPSAELQRVIGERAGRRSRSGRRGVLAVVLTAGVFGRWPRSAAWATPSTR